MAILNYFGFEWSGPTTNITRSTIRNPNTDLKPLLYLLTLLVNFVSDPKQASVERTWRRKGRVRRDVGRQRDEQVSVGEDRSQQRSPQEKEN